MCGSLHTHGDSGKGTANLGDDALPNGPQAPLRTGSLWCRSLNRSLIHHLATGRYLHEKAPVLIVGPSGIGKSHLAQALGHCAVRRGVDVVFTSCSGLTHSLNAARATGVHDRKLATLSRVGLLITTSA